MMNCVTLMRVFFLTILISGTGTRAGSASETDSSSRTLTISCGGVGVEGTFCREGAEAWAKETGHKVKVLKAPNDSSERLALYQQLLGAESADIDVLDIDVVWPGILAPHLVDLKREFEPQREQFVERAWEVNFVDQKLVAIPWFLGAGVLYARTDLLKKHAREIPKTWSELQETAGLIVKKERQAGDHELVGFVFQGRAYEGLTCNALEWIASHGGGRIVEKTGEISVNNPRAQLALQRAKSLVEKTAPPGVLSYTEEEARGVFQSGKAVFMRNWTYAYPLGQAEGSPIRGRFDISRLPSSQSGPHASTLGGWSLGVSKHSKSKQEAISLVRYLTSLKEQKRRLVDGGLYPSRKSFYKDAELLKSDPALKILGESLQSAVARPADATGRQYNRVSSEFYNAVHQTLSGEISPQSALKKLEKRLKRFSRGGRWR